MRHLLFFMKNSSDQKAKVELNIIIAQTSFFLSFIESFISRWFPITLLQNRNNKENGGSRRGSQIEEQPAKRRNKYTGEKKESLRKYIEGDDFPPRGESTR